MSDKEAAEAEAGKAFGTPYYIAPEQIRGDPNIDFRADIYSLGATLYAGLSGVIGMRCAPKNKSMPIQRVVIQGLPNVPEHHP